MAVTWRGSDVLMHPAAGPVRGEARLPGSKSLTNRYLACAALADGRSTLRHASPADDAARMIAGLRALGIRIAVNAGGSQVEVDGCRGQIPATGAEIDAGDAGTALRFLAALAALGHGRYRLDGSARMRQRPIGGLVGALQALGAGIGFDRQPGYPPLTLAARGLSGGQAHLAGPESSQFVSAVLMAAPYAAGDVYLGIAGPLPSRPYVDMTSDVMHALRVEVLVEEDRFVVPAGQRYQPGRFDIEPDASAATYFWAAAAATGGLVTVRGLGTGSRQGDARFVDVLAQMGCTVHAAPDALGVQGPAGGPLRGIRVDLNAMPDTVPTLAVLALFCDGPTEIVDVPNLRVKETDRLAALAAELTKLGAQVEERTDGLRIAPPRAPAAAAIETYGDHRMAMSFAIAGLVVPGITIRNAACVSKSFPRFFQTLTTLVDPESGASPGRGAQAS